MSPTQAAGSQLHAPQMLCVCVNVQREWRAVEEEEGCEGGQHVSKEGVGFQRACWRRAGEDEEGCESSPLHYTSSVQSGQ